MHIHQQQKKENKNRQNKDWFIKKNKSKLRCVCNQRKRKLLKLK